MTTSSQHYLVITALGADRPGIVNTITRHVSSCGCNIEDSRLAMLGEEFTFIMLLSGTWNAITLIESTLPLKGAELDLLIVVNMFLTGFDATTLNTLWVDKNLKYHGLIQAFSRTNRILNSVKTFGNIICFRDLKDMAKAGPHLEPVDLLDCHYYDLAPGQFCLAATAETFYLPDNIAAEFKLKSSLARAGLNHALAGFADPGWTGSVLTLELTNTLRWHSLRLRPGMKAG